jgi:hypothetical protein
MSPELAENLSPCVNFFLSVYTGDNGINFKVFSPGTLGFDTPLIIKVSWLFIGLLYL